MPLNNRSADSYYQLKAIIDHLLDGILTLDENCHIASINPATLTIFGYQLDEMIDLPFAKLLSPPFQKFNIRDYTGTTQ